MSLHLNIGDRQPTLRVWQSMTGQNSFCYPKQFTWLLLPFVLLLLTVLSVTAPYNSYCGLCGHRFLSLFIPMYGTDDMVAIIVVVLFVLYARPTTMHVGWVGCPFYRNRISIWGMRVVITVNYKSSVPKTQKRYTCFTRWTFNRYFYGDIGRRWE